MKPEKTWQDLMKIALEHGSHTLARNIYNDAQKRPLIVSDSIEFLQYQIEQAQKRRNEFCEMALQASTHHDTAMVRSCSREIDTLNLIIDRLSNSISDLKGGDACR